MHNADDPDARLTALEMKASFTEDLVDQLNQVVVRQQTEIDALAQAEHRLRAHIAERSSEGPRDPTDDLPPHY